MKLLANAILKTIVRAVRARTAGMSKIPLPSRGRTYSCIDIWANIPMIRTISSYYPSLEKLIMLNTAK